MKHLIIVPPLFFAENHRYVKKPLKTYINIYFIYFFYFFLFPVIVAKISGFLTYPSKKPGNIGFYIRQKYVKNFFPTIFFDVFTQNFQKSKTLSLRELTYLPFFLTYLPLFDVFLTYVLVQKIGFLRRYL